MTQLSPDWYPAINVRRSRRAFFKDKPLATEAVERMRRVCEGFRPYTGVRTEFFPSPPDDVFANAVGFYGNIKGAPAFLAFIGDTADPNMQEKAGYMGEAAILEATALGLGTCWVALTFNSRAVKSLIKFEKTEKLVCVSPLGYSADNWSFGEKVQGGFGLNHQRKPLTTMVTGLPEQSWPDWARSAVEAARLAPSAMNRQPWGFEVSLDSVTVYVKDKGLEFNVARRLDCGIAMLHIELGALSRGVSGQWELLKHPRVARFSVK